LNGENYCLKLKEKNDEERKQAEGEVKKFGYEELGFVRSFLFMFGMLIGREWTVFKRNPMKGARIIGNSIFSIILVGLIFISAISDNRPSPSTLHPYKPL